MRDSGGSDSRVPESLTLDDAKGQRDGRRPTRTGLLAGVAAVAFGMWVLFGMSGGPDAAPITQTSPTLVPSTTTTTNVVTTTTLLPLEGTWNPILATTRAKPAPPAATCPPGTDPNAPGPSEQDRPRAEYNWLLKAVFDQHAGRIVYLDTAGETWTLDVCTNTWQNMHPESAPAGAGGFDGAGNPDGAIIALVYDPDSDVTVAFGYERVSVYNANINTWTQPENETIGVGDDLIGPMGAAYDAVSGLIITTAMSVGDPDSWDVWAYDVDTNTWTPIGAVPLDRETPCCTQIDFLGYSQEIDRLILTTYVGDAQEATLLIDPRAGETTLISTDSPVVHLVWPGGVYGPAADTVYVKLGGDDICGFDTSTLRWSACFDTPAELLDNWHTVFAAMVGDEINHRLILINSVGGEWWSEATDDVWAIDLDTGEWTELLSPSGQ